MEPLTRRGHRLETHPYHIKAATEKCVVSSRRSRSAVLLSCFHSCPWWLQERHRLRDNRDKGCTSLKKLPAEFTEKDSLKRRLCSGQPGLRGRSRVSSGFCVIVSVLIKVKGVSWIVSLCQTLLLDICCFQVEEMFQDCWVDLTTYYLKLTRCNLTDVPTTNFSHFTQTTALFAFLAQRKQFPFALFL